VLAAFQVAATDASEQSATLVVNDTGQPVNGTTLYVIKAHPDVNKSLPKSSTVIGGSISLVIGVELELDI
jgi:hypothetical protein